MDFKGKNYWAVILGASSGFGLASAQKLASYGMNICAVHRDRRGAMERIEKSFDEIRSSGVELLAVNTNALSAEGRSQVLESLSQQLGQSGRVRLLMHSIALGNLKLLVPPPKDNEYGHQSGATALGEKLGIDPAKIIQAADELLAAGRPELKELASPPEYESEMTLEEEDISQTIYAMGTSLYSWVKAIFEKKMFATDARILSMTSEGNEVAWRAYGAVSAAKVAMEAISRSIALEFAPYGLRCNVVQAGVTDTPALRMIPGNAHLQAQTVMRNPFRRLTRPEDVAGVVALLCSDESAWINGEIIRVDGGEHIAG